MPSALLLLLTLVFAAVPVLAQQFGTETRLSTIHGPSYTPRIAAHNGNLHVVWWEDATTTSGNGEIFYRRSADSGATWIPAVGSAPTNLSNSPTAKDILPIIAAGPRNGGSGSAVYVFWTDNASTGDLRFTRSTDGGASFQPVQTLFAKAGYSRPGSTIVDRQGRVHVAWYDSGYTPAFGSGYGNVIYSMSCDDGASWTTAQLVTRAISIDNEAPRLVEDSSGNIYMLVRSSLDGNPQGGWPPFRQILIRASSVSCGTGTNWLMPPQYVSRGLPFDLGNTYGAKIIPGASGKLHAAWWQESNGNNLTFRSGKPRAGGWGTALDVSEFGPNQLEYDSVFAEFSGFVLAEDSGGGLHAIIPKLETTQGVYNVGPLKYRQSCDGGETWQTRTDAATLPYALYADGLYANGKLHVVWSDLRDQIAQQDVGGPEIYYRAITPTCASIGTLAFSPGSINFGSVVVNKSSAATPITVTNVGNASATISGISVAAPFGVSGTCSGATLAVGATCQINVTFTPTALGSASANITVVSTGAGSPQTINLVGTGVYDLIEHYYVSILGRPSDGGGKAFWQSELARMESLQVDANEVYYVLAGFFFNSDEYKARNRSNSEFVTDLYNTFFMRSPDAGGLAYWVSQLTTGGMPRNMIMYSFLFSDEFKNFMATAIVATPSRPEVYAVVDYYRGLLGRLAESDGFLYWLARFRTAQCTGAAAVNVQVTLISQQFIAGSEYYNREQARPAGQRTAEYVADLYYTFMRRGGEPSGFNYWVQQIDTGAQTRDQVRAKFVESPEFQARVNAIIAKGCYQ